MKQFNESNNSMMNHMLNQAVGRKLDLLYMQEAYNKNNGIAPDTQGVNFFFLQDCVSIDYNKVIIWSGKENFAENPLPKTVDDYFHFLDCEIDFLQKRNSRINNYVNNIK